MELVNNITSFSQKDENPGVMREALESLVRLLTPFVPHICSELWETMGHSQKLEQVGWPEYDDQALVEEEVLVVVQVNGKVRGKVKVPAEASEDQVKEAALSEQNVQRFTEGKTVRKVIVIPGKLVNVVVG